jgi:hypothetical protein
VGFQAGRGSSTATTFSPYNVGVGYQTLYSNSGGYNTAVGPTAGYSITTGSKNTLLGAYTGDQNGVDIRTSSNNIVLSDGDGQQRLVINSSGAWSPAAFGTSYGTSGQVLTTAGSAAVPTWSNPAVAVSNDTSSTAANYPLFAASTSGNLPAKVNSTGYVFYPSANLLKVNGVSIGSGGTAGGAVPHDTNTAVGKDSLANIGAAAAGNYYNTAVGAGALTAVTASATSFNQFNTAVGYNALSSLSATSVSGYSHTAIGAGAGSGLISGYNNTFVGQSSGYLITTGERNVILGSFDGNSSGLDIRTSSNYVVLSDGSGSLRCYFAAGAMYVPGLGSGAGTYAMKYNTTTKQLTYDTSSARYKDNIRDSVYGLSDVLKMRSAMFEYKDDNRTDVGLVAEELDVIVPELVAKNAQGEPDAVSYDRLVSVLIKAVQELNDKFEAYKSSHP